MCSTFLIRPDAGAGHKKKDVEKGVIGADEMMSRWYEIQERNKQAKLPEFWNAPNYQIPTVTWTAPHTGTALYVSGTQAVSSSQTLANT